MAASPLFLQQGLLVWPPRLTLSNKDCWYRRLTLLFPTRIVGMAASPHSFQQGLLVWPPHLSFSNKDCWYGCLASLSPTRIVGIDCRNPTLSNRLCWFFQSHSHIPTIFVENLWGIYIYQQFLLEIYEPCTYTNNPC